MPHRHQSDPDGQHQRSYAGSTHLDNNLARAALEHGVSGIIAHADRCPAADHLGQMYLV
jgi:3-deoxy-D-manno-octulosonic acid (KDO) 8-phosphate synthase